MEQIHQLMVIDISTEQQNFTLAFERYLHGIIQEFSSINFGNGYFGTTAVASAGTNASGNGIFEFDVPTGFTTKG